MILGRFSQPFVQGAFGQTALSTAPQNEVTIVSKRHSGNLLAGIQKYGLDTGLRRYDELAVANWGWTVICVDLYLVGQESLPDSLSDCHGLQVAADFEAGFRQGPKFLDGNLRGNFLQHQTAFSEAEQSQFRNDEIDF